MTLELSLTPWCGLLDHKRLDVLLPCYVLKVCDLAL